jgi:putative transposase
MPYDPRKHDRHSIRLRGFDYTAPAAYFVTICTYNRDLIFGAINDGALTFSRRGLIAQQCWRDIPNHRPYVTLDQFIVMPNHLHGVFCIEPFAERATQVLPLQRAVAHSVGAIVGSYKAAVSRTINKLRPGAGNNLWQRNFFEHIIRDENSLFAIRQYIETNPQRWEDDKENPEGSGRDDVEAWIQQITNPEKRATQVLPLQQHA